MMSIPVRRVMTRFAVLTRICGRVMMLPATVPTVQTPLPAEAQGIRKDDEEIIRSQVRADTRRYLFPRLTSTPAQLRYEKALGRKRVRPHREHRHARSVLDLAVAG